MQKQSPISLPYRSKQGLKIFLGSLILVCVGLYLNTTYSSKNRSEKAIGSLAYTSDCNVEIKLKGEKEETLRFTSQIKEKVCSGSPKPVISPNGEFAAFELRTLTEDLEQKVISNNATYIYIASRKNWAPVYMYGAAEASNLVFTSDNNLQITLWYEGKRTETKLISQSDVLSMYDQENVNAARNIENVPEVKEWRELFTKTQREGKPMMTVDRYDDTEIVFHVYEFFPSDGHSATLNWYRVNRLTGNISREF